MATHRLVPPRHYRLEDLEWERLGDGMTHAVVQLRPGQCVDNPASTKNPIWGPGLVSFVRWPDGGVDVQFQQA